MPTGDSLKAVGGISMFLAAASPWFHRCCRCRLSGRQALEARNGLATKFNDMQRNATRPADEKPASADSIAVTKRHRSVADQ